MSKEKERESEAKRSFCRPYCSLNSKKGVRDGESGYSSWVSCPTVPPEKIRVFESNWSDPSWDGLSSGKSSGPGSSGAEPQDADYSDVPSLNDEVEGLILARVPRSEYWKFCLVNKRYLSLVKSGDIYKIRKEIGFKEYSIFMLASGGGSWWAFDRQFEYRRKLPDLPFDLCFMNLDKETLCAGTHLMVSGRELHGAVIWRYELATNQWFKSDPMNNPRCLFASATCGTFAFVAGGIRREESNLEVLDSVEKYDPESKQWESLPSMKRKRKSCSGCYMDNKFYVIGGQDENGHNLICGEAFDEDKNTWELIPDMLKGSPVSTSQSPPLVAVVNNELYSLEASSNELKVYLKKTNTWKKLGPVPVRADFNRGWGVAFKSLGNELLLIGASSIYGDNAMKIYKCCPDPDAEEQPWRLLDSGRSQLSHFILNCSVMVA